MITLVFKTDAHHSYSSRELIGACTSKKHVLSIIRQRVKKECKKLDSDQLFNIDTIGQTQGYLGDGEFATENVELNVLV